MYKHNNINTLHYCTHVNTNRLATLPDLQHCAAPAADAHVVCPSSLSPSLVTYWLPPPPTARFFDDDIFIYFRKERRKKRRKAFNWWLYAYRFLSLTLGRSRQTGTLRSKANELVGCSSSFSATRPLLKGTRPGPTLGQWRTRSCERSYQEEKEDCVLLVFTGHPSRKEAKEAKEQTALNH